MTQLVVEVVTTVLLLLGPRWLPKRIDGDDPGIARRARIRRTRDLVLAIFAGAGLAALSYAMFTCSSTPLSWNSRSARVMRLRKRRIPPTT